MTEQLDTIPKEDKAEKEARRSSLEKHRKEKPFKTGRGRISTPERKIAKKEPSTVSRDEVRRKKGSFNNHFFQNVFEVTHYYSLCGRNCLTVVTIYEILFGCAPSVYFFPDGVLFFVFSYP